MVASLQTLLEGARPGFAYELLTLQIEIDNNQMNIDITKNTQRQENYQLIAKLSTLIQLYMLGVQVLESNGDNRYKYFNQKIQGLMKKKHIIQELHYASTGKKASQSIIKQTAADQIDDRKAQHEIQVFLNSEQCQIKKIKEIMQQEDKKYNNYKKKIGENVRTQNQNLEERRKLRKMKSEAKSIRNFDLGSNPPDEKQRDFMIDNVQSHKKYTKQEDLPRKKLTKARSSKNLFINDLNGEGLKRRGSIQKGKIRILDLQ